VSENALAETADLLGVLGNDWIDGRQLALRVDGRVAKIELMRSNEGSGAGRARLATGIVRPRAIALRQALPLPGSQFVFEPAHCSAGVAQSCARCFAFLQPSGFASKYASAQSRNDLLRVASNARAAFCRTTVGDTEPGVFPTCGKIY